jgi:hypothetical protein
VKYCRPNEPPSIMVWKEKQTIEHIEWIIIIHRSYTLVFIVVMHCRSGKNPPFGKVGKNPPFGKGEGRDDYSKPRIYRTRSLPNWKVWYPPPPYSGAKEA